MALHETFLSQIAHQCAWCAQVMDGELEGEVYLEGQNKTLQLWRLPQYSHGCCAECRKRFFDRYRRDKNGVRTQDSVIWLKGGVYDLAPAQ